MNDTYTCAYCGRLSDAAFFVKTVENVGEVCWQCFDSAFESCGKCRKVAASDSLYENNLCEACFNPVAFDKVKFPEASGSVPELWDAVHRMSGGIVKRSRK